MATQSLSIPLDSRTSRSAKPQPAALSRRSRSVLRRLLEAMIESQRRRAEREIQFYLGATGQRLTDGVERELERRAVRSQ